MSEDSATPDAMVDEFDSMATWTAEAVAQLGEDHALPAACRGSGSPAALQWLMERMDLAPDALFADVGAGVGGPAEYAARQRNLRPILLDPMLGACRAAAQLFARPVLVAEGAALPFGDATFEGAWSLGVLCTLEDKASHLREWTRVLAARGVLGLIVYERTDEASLAEEPEGNHFPHHTELTGLLREAGLHIVSAVALSDLAPPPTTWTDAASRADSLIEQAHGSDSRWQRAHAQEEKVIELIDAGRVAGRALVCRRP